MITSGPSTSTTNCPSKLIASYPLARNIPLFGIHSAHGHPISATDWPRQRGMQGTRNAVHYTTSSFHHRDFQPLPLLHPPHIPDDPIFSSRIKVMNCSPLPHDSSTMTHVLLPSHYLPLHAGRPRCRPSLSLGLSLSRCHAPSNLTTHTGRGSPQCLSLC